MYINTEGRKLVREQSTSSNPEICSLLLPSNNLFTMTTYGYDGIYIRDVPVSKIAEYVSTKTLYEFPILIAGI